MRISKESHAQHDGCTCSRVYFDVDRPIEDKSKYCSELGTGVVQKEQGSERKKTFLCSTS